MLHNFRDKMKILQLCIRFPPAPGGAENHVYHISRELIKRGHDLRVFTSDLYTEVPFVRLKNPGQMYKGIPVRRFKSYSFGGEMHYIFIPSILRALLKEKPDIIHTHSYGYYQTTATALAKKLKTKDIPLVVTPHFHPPWSMWGGMKRKQLRKIYDRFFGRPVMHANDVVICHSENEKELLSNFSIASERIKIIPAGIDFKRFEPIPDPDIFREFYDIKGPTVLYVGRLASNKGLEYLISAVPAVLSQFTDTTFVLIGEDEGQRKLLEDKAKNLGVKDNVVFTGHITDEKLFESAYSACDVFVLPSEYEAFGLVLLEAMACKKPCVATKVGGVPEVVDHGKTGILIEYGKPELLSNAIIELLDDEDRRKNMGRQGRERVKEKFTWPKIVNQLEDLYEDLLTRDIV
ncbi:MAG: glycosyltransferase family 4 protein [Thermoplasmata archaeon]|nr:MAG: glycosyltransferase family 4 protein [Thermoplasmata archaeon]